jgi:hypothetical protein
MPTLSEHDPEPEARRSGPRLRLAAVIAVVLFIVVALHLTGVVGPG